MSRPRSLTGQVVAITGGARGIGAEIAAGFSAAGAQVAIGDIHLDEAQATGSRLGVRAYRLDVADPESQKEFLTAVARDLGPVDIVVGNAGLMWVGPFEQEPDSAARAQIEVNLLGVINGIKAAAPAMVARGSGHLITVASAGSILPTPGEATYAATKHGVLGYLKAVRAEMRGSGVRVTAIMPGVVDTTLAAGTSSGAAKLLTPAEVARAVVKAAARPRFEVTVPGFIGPGVRVVSLLPTPIRDRIFAALVPNQLDAKKNQRSGYEASFTAQER
ncbi:SDR family oxidoreductase [Brevibacterium marinum]|jgi:NADP-dependent 3-hydroxy acid dehydrogenase YdfG|uniref:NADP-dependent 3-hydroxy acid dehydrogenase YdfG n=1 Tax=Brevibacterium marinum TaxID=418643 RepID=A0A846RXS6_9MICO|nr:SDR family oxidoreductase [Brevibacterium marinum]NJC58629.1 NADP-dependent 3-hydroxy acid dehydrogenase YdfG [Brevibacterium marinum]